MFFPRQVLFVFNPWFKGFLGQNMARRPPKSKEGINLKEKTKDGEMVKERRPERV